MRLAEGRDADVSAHVMGGGGAMPDASCYEPIYASSKSPRGSH